MVLRVIDLETTGIDPETDKIIEIAMVDIGRDGLPAAHQSTLVNPGRPIPPETSAIHHLIDQDVAGAPNIEDTQNAFKGTDAVFIAHHARFESGFLTPLWGEHPWICTMKCALRVWPDAPGHSNQVLRYWLGLIDPMGVPRNKIDPHRALSDCFTTGAIMFRLMQEAKWADLVTWSAEPALHTKFTFGKHRGKRFDEAPSDYLEWIIDKSEMDEDVKFSAKHWLKKKAGALL